MTLSDDDDALSEFLREARAEVRPITVAQPRPHTAAYSRGVEVSLQVSDNTVSMFDISVGELQALVDAGQRLLKELGHG